MLVIKQLTVATDFHSMEKSTTEVYGDHQLFGYQKKKTVWNNMRVSILFCPDTTNRSRVERRLTSWPASKGMYSMMASRTLHLASSASSTIAGSKDWESCRIPITSFTQSRLEMMFRRTSGHYRKIWKKIILKNFFLSDGHQDTKRKENILI